MFLRSYEIYTSPVEEVQRLFLTKHYSYNYEISKHRGSRYRNIPTDPWEVVANTFGSSVRAVGTTAMGCRFVNFTTDLTYYRSSLACITCRRLINGTDRQSFGVVTFYLGSLERSCCWSSYWCDTHTHTYTHILRLLWGRRLPTECTAAYRGLLY
jgi:hypothetical protein